MGRPISPLNDFKRVVYIEVVDTDENSSTFGTAVPLTAANQGGPVTAFLAKTGGPEEVTANALFSVECKPYQNSPGDWLVFMDAGNLTVEAMDASFTEDDPPYLIVVAPNDVRKVEKLDYQRISEATIV